MAGKTKIKTSHFLQPDDFRLKFQTVVIAGVNRSGKTAIGNILATAENVEHSDEPWLLYILPIMVRTGMMDESIGKELFLTYLSELMNDVVLLRRANFRPGDLSSILNQKTSGDIDFRLNKLEGRKDVKNFLKNKRPLLLLNLSESGLDSILLLSKWLPRAKFLLLERNPEDVAKDLREKKWLSNDQLLKPLNAQVYKIFKHRNKKYYLPWWINKGDEKKFMRLDDHDRGLYFSGVMKNSAKKTIAELESESRCMTVRFEDLIKDTDATIKRTASFLDIKLSPFTKKSIAKFKQHG